MVFKKLDKDTAPIEIYTYYSVAILLDILKEKDLFNNADMKKLIRRVNAKLRKDGYK